MATQYLAIVTGGAQGIGHGIAEALLQTGAKVHFLDFDDAEGHKAQKEFDEKFGTGKAKFVHCDVSIPDELEKAFRQAKTEMGGLNVICNNAGIACPLGERTRWEKVVATNLGATINGSFLGYDLLDKDGNGGVIINTSSLAGLEPAPYAPVYTSTKAGIIGFTRSAAITSPKGVRINVLCPDFTDTKLVRNVMTEMQQVMSEEDFKKMILENIHKTERKDQNVAEQTAPLQPIEIGIEVVNKLIKEKSKHGEVLIVSKARGTSYHTFK
ncbi:15-hydroxyprostaglandin dehydrogenase [NAD(+)]-like [Paramuricea clavata]|uniref:15-hydroxyprostaglandin dehydrogenase [NAD(+)] n=1 Tax=Paramuricea clavata TaxID=317549 RepID=A0A7D9HND9_PARCT|nr:15-hydroxyprostaglandin dehydrogenase [NAD(+)]-like [Paramuricea clavata]